MRRSTNVDPFWSNLRCLNAWRSRVAVLFLIILALDFLADAQRAGSDARPTSAAVVDVVHDCGAPTDTLSDAFPSIQNCIFDKMQTHGDDHRLSEKSITFHLPKICTGNHSSCIDFRMSHMLDLPWNARLEGDGTGMGATRLKWPVGVSGIYARGFNWLSHLFLEGSEPWNVRDISTFVLPKGWGRSTDASDADGVRMGSKFTAYDVVAMSFGRHGFNGDVGSGVIPGNMSDEDHLVDVLAQENRGIGIIISGADGNSGQCDRCEARGNQLWGMYDGGMTGNQWNSPLTDHNHDDLTGGQESGWSPYQTIVRKLVCLDHICTITTSSPHGLYEHDVVRFREIQVDKGLNWPADFSVASVPSPTNYTIFYNHPDETVALSAAPGWQSYLLGSHIWAAAGQNGGGYFMGSGIWFRAYAEGNQTPSVVGALNFGDWLNAIDFADHQHRPTLLRGGWGAWNVTGLTINPLREPDGHYSQSRIDLGNGFYGFADPALSVWNQSKLTGSDHDYSGLTFGRDRYGDNSGWWCWENYGNDNTSHVYGDICLGDAKTVTRRSAKDTSPYPKGKLWAPNGIFLHGANASAYHWLGGGYIAPPASGSWIHGDIIINDTPKEGGCWAWVAITDGTPGTWGCLGTVSTNESNPRFAPPCNLEHRFQFKSVPGSAGVKDTVQICAKDAKDAYAWRTLY